MRGPNWTKLQDEVLLRVIAAGIPVSKAAAGFPEHTAGAVAHRMYMLRRRRAGTTVEENGPPAPPAADSQHPAVQLQAACAADAANRVAAVTQLGPFNPRLHPDREAIRAADLHNPVDTRPHDRVRELEAELARIRQQNIWAQRADAPVRTGGVFTLRASDHHYGDKNHLLSCGRSMVQKAAVLVEQYLPDRIQIVAGDDLITGRGIYREQDLDCVTSEASHQLQIGAMHIRELLLAIRAVTQAPITWHIMRGNHDYHNGVSLTAPLFYMAKTLCEDIIGTDFVQHDDSITLNLAADGIYNVLIRHGTGHSEISPNAPRFINSIRDEIIVKHQFMGPNEHYRRVLSGHTHWCSIGVERQIGLFWDTTGGLQRNVRIRIGDNQRPIGWIVYVSLPGLANNILSPIPVQPDNDTYLREICDPHLPLSNFEDAARLLREFDQIMRDRGALGPAASFGQLNSGRW